MDRFPFAESIRSDNTQHVGLLELGSRHLLPDILGGYGKEGRSEGHMPVFGYVRQDFLSEMHRV